MPWTIGILLCLALLAAALPPAWAGTPPESPRAQARRQERAGNFLDAAALFRAAALSPAAPPAEAAIDLRAAFENFVRLDRDRDAEALLAEAVAVHSGVWQVLSAAAVLQTELPPEVVRTDSGYARMNDYAEPVFSAAEADRVRSLQLLLRAEALLATDAGAAERDKLDFYRRFHTVLLRWRGGQLAWRLTALTDLSAVPEPEDAGAHWARPHRAAPVAGDGKPVLYRTPTSWQDAANDGERLRWLLARMAESGGPAGSEEADWLFGRFLLEQFGTQTLERRYTADKVEDEESSLSRALQSLTEDETLARLATGQARLRLPEEFNHIYVLRRVAAGGGERAAAAAATLAEVFENRQQYPAALSCWRMAAEMNPAGTAAANAINRIAGASGSLLPEDMSPAGTASFLTYIHRNGAHLSLTAHRLDEELLLADIRTGLKSGSASGQSRQALLHPEQIGRYVVEMGAEKYRGRKVADWTVTLAPKPDHFSTREKIQLPFTAAGCYLIEAELRDGGTSRLVFWLTDLALVKKDAGGGAVYFLADARTGEPHGGATLTLIGSRVPHWSGTDGESGDSGPAMKEIAHAFDASGLAVVESLDEGYTWLSVAKAPDGRFAYLGFERMWRGLAGGVGDDAPPPSAFIMTDSPLYRPGQAVRFRLWLGQGTYTRAFDPAGRSVTVTVTDPDGAAAHEVALTTDKFGGACGGFTLPAGAKLGTYLIQTNAGSGNAFAAALDAAVLNLIADSAAGQVAAAAPPLPASYPGALSFRVEEYRKPEYEVSVSVPESAVRLGGRAEVTVAATYYFGSPVADAAVTYRVLRSALPAPRPLRGRWDWLYAAPAGFFPQEPPEVVAEGEGRLDDSGKFVLSVDTASALESFADTDHVYTVEAEVQDASRRTVTGSGRYAAAVAPFRVSVWTTAGLHWAGGDAGIAFHAALPLGGPLGDGVAAAGTATLYRLTATDSADGTDKETEVASVAASSDAAGDGIISFPGLPAGAYRVRVRLVDANGGVAAGAADFTVRGDGPAGGGGNSARYPALEILAEAPEYAVGGTARLAVNSRRTDATVVLFVRAERGGTPRLLRLVDGTHVFDVPVGPNDQPNFFCEAFTVFDGKLHHETLEIAVPPAEQTINVEVTPDSPRAVPGGAAAFTVKATDTSGRPVAAQLTIAVYDKAVEYISGGENATDIRRHFWGWRRSYFPDVGSSLLRSPYEVYKPEGGGGVGVAAGAAGGFGGGAVYANGLLPRSRMQLEAVVLSDMAVSVPALAAPAEAAAGKMDATIVGGGAGAADDGGVAPPPVRTNFADVALWLTEIETDASGSARFTLTLPDSLTTWKALVWAAGPGTRVGKGESAVTAAKDVIVRPQTPRFLTQFDRAVLSANLHNYLSRPLAARAELTLEGGVLEPAAATAIRQEFSLSPGGAAHADWAVFAARPGGARVTVSLASADGGDAEGDAAAVELPVLLHGSRRMEPFGGILRSGESDAAIRFTVPAARLPESSRLELSFSAGLAPQLLAALPHLAASPYETTEGILNRFQSAVMLARYFERLGAVPPAGKQNAADGTNAPDALPDGSSPGVAGLPDAASLAALVQTGVEKLSSMQNPDGGWGWFSGPGERSWPHMTAVVVYGLAAAGRDGAAIPFRLLEDGVAWLRGYETEQLARLRAFVQTDGKSGRAAATSLDAFIFMILAEHGHASPAMRDFLFRDRLSLSLSAQCMFALSLHRVGATALLARVADNIRQHRDANAELALAWLRVPDSGWWFWQHDPIETQAWYLRLLAATYPSGSEAPAVANYLLQNRKHGSYWQSTRSSAYAIEALLAHAAAAGEDKPDATVTLLLDGRPVLTRRLTAENLLAENRFVLEGVAVEEGEHELRLVRSGAGNIYYGGGLSTFTLADPIPAAGRELTVTRRYYRLVKEDAPEERPDARGRAVAVPAGRYKRVPLPGPFDATDAADAAAVPIAPGDLLEVELSVAASHDCEYLLLADPLPAGCEAAAVQSGYDPEGAGAYIEYRDSRTNLFIRHLPRGTFAFTYRLRAITPGRFSALPAGVAGVYAPDLAGSSGEMKVEIAE